MIGQILALLGVFFTAGQALLLFTEQEAICFNSGCAIVEELTRVSPLFINIVGGFYFITLLLLQRKFLEDKVSSWLLTTLLLAGVPVEAVLIAFQFYIAQTFCSYCVIICSLVFALNLFYGAVHALRGAALFFAVFFAFSALKFTLPPQDLDHGTYAVLSGEQRGVKRYLFFSETCPHCEEVVAQLDKQNICEVRFNPISQIDKFSLAGVIKREKYRPDINLHFLQSLAIGEVPVLVVQGVGGGEIIKGQQKIERYFLQNCQPQVGGKTEVNSVTTGSYLDYLDVGDEENCEIDTSGVDCTSPKTSGESR